MATRRRTFGQIMRIKRLPVIAIDEHSNITYNNQEFERQFGWTGEDLLGQPVTILMPHAFRVGHTIGLRHSIARKPKEITIAHNDFSVLCKDGSEQWCEHFIVGKLSNGIWSFVAIIKPIVMPSQMSNYPMRNAEQ